MRILTPLLVLVLLAALTACSKLSMENYDKIKAGMEYDEVVALLGKPDTCSEAVGVRSCQWGDEQSHVQVNFVNERVLLSYAHNLK